MDIINPHRFSTAAPTVDFDGFGNASRSFNGVDSQVTVEDNADLPTGAQTWACWVKLNSTGVNQDLMAHWAADTNEASILLRITTADKINFAIANDPSGSPFGNTQTVSTGTLNSGQWYHIAATFDPSNTVKIYINGSLDITRTSGVLPAVYDSSAPLTFGNRIDRTFVLDGNLCDCRIYNAALDATDIAALYGGENITTNLIGHWLKDTPSLLDHSGTNDGTNIGSAFAYDNPSPEVEFGKASRVFDRTAVQYVSVPDSATFPTGAQTHACWFKPDATITGGQSILGKWGNGGNLSFLLYYINLDLRAYVSGDGSSNVNTGAYSLSPPTGAWHHAAFVFVPSTSLTLYINGSQVTQVTSGVPASLYDTSAEYRIGKMDRSYNAPFGGHVCDVRMYDTDLSSTDITALYNGTNVETNLIGHWLTNTDDVKDYAGVNDGTNIGSTYSFDNPLGNGGEFGSASREFSGTNQYITLANSAFPTGDFSISLWVKRHTTDWYDYLSMWEGSSTNRKFALMNQNYSNRVIFYWVDNTSTAYNIGSTSGTVLNANEWYHVGVTYEAGVAAKVYINGVEDGSSTSAGTLQSSTADLMIAARDGSTAYALDGNLADVRIYDTAITATDMYDLSRGYDFRTNLVGQWLTNKDDVDDYAGSNNGTNNGSTYSQNAPL